MLFAGIEFRFVTNGLRTARFDLVPTWMCNCAHVYAWLTPLDDDSCCRRPYAIFVTPCRGQSMRGSRSLKFREPFWMRCECTVLCQLAIASKFQPLVPG